MEEPMSKFNNVLAAVQEREKHKEQITGSDLWAIADALVLDCGLPGPRQRDASAKIRECAAELKQHGFSEYSKSYLDRLRSIVNHFKPDLLTSPKNTKATRTKISRVRSKRRR
jgi:hypothetical protein